MPKKVSEIQIREMIASFIIGKTIDELSEKYSCTKLTITRHLKKNIGEEEYKNLIKMQKPINELKEVFTKNTENKSFNKDKVLEEKISEEKIYNDSEFVELAPITYEIDNKPQKDLTSIHISEMKFPQTVYMVVDKKIELDIKLLRDFPEWQFLSQQELDRKTIQVFYDMKIAKRFCNKEQKIIKVPNTNVFEIVAPFLLNRGISRIVSADKLVAL